MKSFIANMPGPSCAHAAGRGTPKQGRRLRTLGACLLLAGAGTVFAQGASAPMGGGQMGHGSQRMHEQMKSLLGRLQAGADDAGHGNPSAQAGTDQPGRRGV
jgi:hypothetical protein